MAGIARLTWMTSLALLLGWLTPALAQPAPTPVRILTWNVGTLNPLSTRLPRDAEDRVVDAIVAAQPDVVTLQEIRDLAQVQRIADALDRLGHTYHPFIAEVDPRRDDGRSQGFLTRAPPSATPQFVATSNFKATAVVLPDVTVVNVHSPSTSVADRSEFFDELLPWAQTLPGVVVLAGDFNLGPRCGAGLSAFLPWLARKDRATYRDLAAAFPTHTDLGSTTYYGLTLDHVMAPAGIVFTHSQVLRGYRRLPQDHNPLLVDLEIPAPTPAPAPPATSGMTGALRNP